jgi:Domain of unknown function (DUF1330)
MVEARGGRYLARTLRVEAIEGERTPRQVFLIIELPSEESADAEPQRMLHEGGAPINERLRRVFSQFRIGSADEETISVLPVLRPDVIETRAAPTARSSSSAQTSARTPMPCRC